MVEDLGRLDQRGTSVARGHLASGGPICKYVWGERPMSRRAFQSGKQHTLARQLLQLTRTTAARQRERHGACDSTRSKDAQLEVRTMKTPRRDDMKESGCMSALWWRPFQYL